MNLKLIGHFADGGDAREVAAAIEILTEAARLDQESGDLTVGEPLQRYSDRLLRAMSEVNVNSLGYADVEQLLYEADIRVDEADVVVETDEIDVLAYVKVFLAKGAKIEMYSMHDHDDTVAKDQ